MCATATAVSPHDSMVLLKTEPIGTARPSIAHSDFFTVATTQNHYIKTASPDAIAAMKQFSEALLCSTFAPDGAQG